MRKYSSAVLLLSTVVFIVFFSVTFLYPAKGFGDEREVMIIELEGPISSGAATNLTRGIKAAEDHGASLVIIQLDTPGGLVVSMKTMVKTIMNSSVPVVVFVSPKGAGAASHDLPGLAGQVLVARAGGVDLLGLVAAVSGVVLCHLWAPFT